MPVFCVIPAADGHAPPPAWRWPTLPPDCPTYHAMREPDALPAPDGWQPIDAADGDADLVDTLRRLHPGRDVLLIGAGCALPDAWLPRLLAAGRSGEHDVVCALDRGVPQLDPGLGGTLAQCDALCWRYGAHAVFTGDTLSAGLSWWRAAPQPESSGPSAEPSQGLTPCLCVHSPGRRASAGAAPSKPIQALREAANGLSAPLSDGLPGADGLPVVLHVLHGWGGGAEKFVRDLMAADSQRRHLLLVAESDPARRLHGTALALHDHRDAPALARWPLARPIPDTVESCLEYRQILGEILGTWSIGAVLVSSVIGHSLDVLRTGLPTAVCCHDHYPLWPWLDARFDGSERFDADDLRERLHRDPPAVFVPHAPGHWLRLAQAWREAIGAANATLVAPSSTARTHLVRIAPELDDCRWRIIGHGLDGCEPLPGARRTRRNRLRVLVPGRIAGGKGADLLNRLIPRLDDRIELILLGCGAEGMHFFGARNVHVVLNYLPSQLPGLVAGLRPDVALLPRTVAETFSYTLSEMWALGVPVIATRCGSLAERIVEGRTGLLAEPDAESLLALLQALAEKPDPLSQLVPGPGRSCAAMAEDWREALPAQPRPIAMTSTAASDIARRLDLELRLAASRRKETELAQTIAVQRDELDARAQWASELERLAARARDDAEKARTQSSTERDALQHSLPTTLARLEEANLKSDSLEAELGKAQVQVGTLAAQAGILQNQISALQADLEQARLREDASAQAASELQLSIDRLEEENLALLARAERADTSLAQAYDLYDRDVADLASQRDIALAQRDQLQSQLGTLIGSRSWRLTAPFRLLRRRVQQLRASGGFRWRQVRNLTRRLMLSLGSRGWRGTLARVQQEFDGGRRNAALDPITGPRVGPICLPCPSRPRASVIVPAYNQIEHTLACLRSLAASGDQLAFEVIVVDDHSSDDTPSRLETVDGLRWHRNERNLGFIGACNAGALLARGEFIVFLNNDTLVRPGWLDALIDTFDAQPRAGLVGAKLIYPDGRLQEAGGVVFSDASGWNVGRFEDPADPRYNVLRDVDYCSGAAIALRRELFTELGGFDPRYTPAYYEDTDLAMKVRAHGLRVLYQPRSEVIHCEGVSHGTDVGSGIKAYQVHNQARFLERWRDVLERDHARPGTRIEMAIDHRCRKRVLVVDACTPKPDRDSGSLRMFNLLRLLREDGCAVTFFADNRAHDGAYTEALQQLGVEVWWHPYIGSPVSWLGRHGAQIDLAIISRHYIASAYLPLLREYAPRAKVVFDTVDLHYLREQREAELTADMRLARRAAHTREQELSVIADSDLTLVVSPFEQKLLARELPEARVCVVSNVHQIAADRPDFEQRNGLVFVGGFRHPPNVDAARWFVESVYPLIRRQNPDIELHLIGADMPESISALGQQPGIQCHGYVPDIEPWMSGCRVSLAPLRYGAGVKGKVNLSMAHGQPVVATSCAVEGMFLRDGEDVLVADDPESFADAVLRLHGDPVLWRRLADNGVENVRQHFSFDSARKVIRQELIGPEKPGRRPLLHSVPRTGQPG
jgi:GT2 family glycosyltransferase/predicted  nucleic acid-binding Zn-ribbon protein